jgi:hypothetical protein
MTELVGVAAKTTGIARRRSAIAWMIERDQALLAAATVVAWTHTLDEMRIGEFVAVPFGVANAALVAAWPRLGTRTRAALAMAFGLFWGVTAIPYHVAPLVAGAVTWQNVSGLARIVAGVAMVALGIAITSGHRDAAPPDQTV